MRPINPTTPEELSGDHIVVATNGNEIAIYLKSGNSTVGRMFCTQEEFLAISETLAI